MNHIVEREQKEGRTNMEKCLLISSVALSVAVAFAAVNQIRINFILRELERQQQQLWQQLERIRK